MMAEFISEQPSLVLYSCAWDAVMGGTAVIVVRYFGFHYTVGPPSRIFQNRAFIINVKKHNPNSPFTCSLFLSLKPQSTLNSN